jgi:hypothetical protein
VHGLSVLVHCIHLFIPPYPLSDGRMQTKLD